MAKKKKKDSGTNIAFVSTADGSEMVTNVETEEEAYESVMGEPWPENGPDDDLEWECQVIHFKSGESIDISRYM